MQLILIRIQLRNFLHVTMPVNIFFFKYYFDINIFTKKYYNIILINNYFEKIIRIVISIIFFQKPVPFYCFSYFLNFSTCRLNIFKKEKYTRYIYLCFVVYISQNRFRYSGFACPVQYRHFSNSWFWNVTTCRHVDALWKEKCVSTP